MGHVHPFIAEDGCGAYLPEDYFHLRPVKTVRLGRFMCIPVAAQQPAAAEALDAVAGAAEVNVVPLRSLSPRELAQNSGLPGREAELLRQRDFDELFFLAGASQQDVERLLTEAHARNIQLRERGVLWSAAVGASLPRCVRELSKLYERALRRHPATVGAGTARDAANLFPACDRRIVLSEAGESSQPSTVRQISLRSPTLWQDVRDEIVPKRL